MEFVAASYSKLSQPCVKRNLVFDFFKWGFAYLRQNYLNYQKYPNERRHYLCSKLRALYDSEARPKNFLSFLSNRDFDFFITILVDWLFTKNSSFLDINVYGLIGCLSELFVLQKNKSYHLSWDILFRTIVWNAISCSVLLKTYLHNQFHKNLCASPKSPYL